MAEAVEVEAASLAGPSMRPLELEPDEPRPERSQPRDPPIIFPDIDVSMLSAYLIFELSAFTTTSVFELKTSGLCTFLRIGI